MNQSEIKTQTDLVKYFLQQWILTGLKLAKQFPNKFSFRVFNL